MIPGHTTAPPQDMIGPLQRANLPTYQDVTITETKALRGGNQQKPRENMQNSVGKFLDW